MGKRGLEWTRHHIVPRSNLYNPEEVFQGPRLADLKEIRVTEMTQFKPEEANFISFEVLEEDGDPITHTWTDNWRSIGEKKTA